MYMCLNVTYFHFFLIVRYIDRILIKIIIDLLNYFLRNSLDFHVPCPSINSIVIIHYYR